MLFDQETYWVPMYNTIDYSHVTSAYAHTEQKLWKKSHIDLDSNLQLSSHKSNALPNELLGLTDEAIEIYSMLLLS